jgi:uncharacterized protein YyaL (SSP411 family)
VEKSPNRLSNESSPYLLQHATNPVNWFPWCDEALELAKERDIPIFLSVGYSACHWCHVMEHESFENEEIARLMNDHFVNIKVDREERPDLDEVYMSAVQMMTGSGGWPMSVFLTPDCVPFYGGTYFPPDNRYGRPGFPDVLKSVARHYKENPGKIQETAEKLMTGLNRMADLKNPQGRLDTEIVSRAYESMAQNFDSRNGGFGSQPKFPNSMNLSVFFREYAARGNEQAKDMALLTLKKMAGGGIYDHLGGGFHRYSVDDRWLVPHFEKMLYDNALLTNLYLEGYRITTDSLYKRVVVETLGYVVREMTQDNGGFYSTQDADSEGEEGKFFVWDQDEIQSVLGADDGDLFCRYYDVTKEGNFEDGRSILNIPHELVDVAELLGVEKKLLIERLEIGRRKLFEVRETRIKPGRDEKIQANWNGLMISAFAQASQVLENPSYLRIAESAASFILREMRNEKGLLLHTYKDGNARFIGYQDDYAFLIAGLIDLYEATFEMTWLQQAEELCDSMVDQFWDSGEGGFFFAGPHHESLIVRSKNPYDNAIPSGNSVGVMDLMRLGVLLDREDLRDRASQTLRLFQPFMAEVPTGFGQMLCSLNFFLEGPHEIAIVGSPGDPQTQELLQAVAGHYVPNRVVALKDPDKPDDLTARIKLLANKGLVGGRPAAYVCRNFTCDTPVTKASELETQLASS